MTRSTLPLIVAAALAVAVTAPTSAQAQRVPPPARAETMAPPDPPPSEADRLQTSDQVKRGSVEGAVTTPLRDLNVMRVGIPEVLQQALDDPYARPPRNARCATLIELIRPLNDVLGPDIDTIPSDDENLPARGRSTALGVAGDLAGGAIPFRGVVRRLTGAESHDRLVAAAIIAGHTRRAYLKGLGEARGCGPPATPSHERTAMLQAAARAAAGPPPPVANGGALTPRYPTRAQPADAPRTNGGNPRSGPARPRN